MQKASFLHSLWLIPVMQSHRSACRWEEFVWTRKNVEEGLAWRMSSAFPCTVVERRADDSPVPASSTACLQQPEPQRGLRAPSGRDGTTSVLSLRAHTVLRPPVCLPVLRPEGYILKKHFQTALCFEPLGKAVWTARMPSLY